MLGDKFGIPFCVLTPHVLGQFLALFDNSPVKASLNQVLEPHRFTRSSHMVIVAVVRRVGLKLVLRQIVGQDSDTSNLDPTPLMAYVAISMLHALRVFMEIRDGSHEVAGAYFVGVVRERFSAYAGDSIMETGFDLDCLFHGRSPSLGGWVNR